MGDLLDIVLQLAALVILALGGLAVRRLSDWLGLRADGEVRAYLNAALDRAVEFGLAEARRRAREAGVPVPAGGIAAAAARQYARDRVPEALARFGINEAALDDMIRARLPKPPAHGAT